MAVAGRRETPTTTSQSPKISRSQNNGVELFSSESLIVWVPERKQNQVFNYVYILYLSYVYIYIQNQRLIIDMYTGEAGGSFPHTKTSSISHTISGSFPPRKHPTGDTINNFTANDWELELVPLIIGILPWPYCPYFRAYFSNRNLKIMSISNRKRWAPQTPPNEPPVVSKSPSACSWNRWTWNDALDDLKWTGCKYGFYLS